MATLVISGWSQRDCPNGSWCVEFSCCSCVWTYAPKGTTQCFFASYIKPVTISRGLKCADTPSFTGKAFSQKVIAYTSSATILLGIFLKRSVLTTDRHRYFSVLIYLYISGTCSSLDTAFSPTTMAESSPSSVANSLSSIILFTTKPCRAYTALMFFTQFNRVLDYVLDGFCGYELNRPTDRHLERHRIDVHQVEAYRHLAVTL